jgi:hypothetical protein
MYGLRVYDTPSLNLVGCRPAMGIQYVNDPELVLRTPAPYLVFPLYHYYSFPEAGPRLR